VGRPGRVEECPLGHDLTGVGGEVLQRAELPRLQADHGSVRAGQAMLSTVETKAQEVDDRGHVGVCHGLSEQFIAEVIACPSHYGGIAEILEHATAGSIAGRSAASPARWRILKP